jgi:hypothetical protein
MRKKWIIKQVDDDNVLHFLLKNKVFDKREDCIFMPLDSTLDSADTNEADIILLNPGLSSKINSNKKLNLVKNDFKSSVILLLNSKKQLDQISTDDKHLYIEKGLDSITKITDLIEDVIFQLYEKERNIRIAN